MERPAPATRSPYVVPTPYGRPSSTDGLSTVAAPLLAAGAITLIGVVVQQETALRHPGMTLLLLTAATALLIMAVQCGSWARRYVTSPAEIQQWWPEANRARQEIIEREQRRHARRHRLWARRFTLTFNLGMVCLYLALAAAVMPRAGSDEAGWRWAASGTAITAAVLEILWTGLGMLGMRPFRISRWIYGHENAQR
ncbi:MAG TPA: hypothetical protein VFC19_47430 [Candidatus Limnocylindrales bacterium]|nr:hypothetical protein [Candidatus Limnocylindrales bacterium]